MGTSHPSDRDRAGSAEPALSEAQQLIVDHGEGPLLVIAGPGSGKTRVLAERYVRLVESGEARVGQILLLAYNRDAAAEMLRRVTARLGPGDHSIHTFHAFARRILLEHGWLAGLPTQFRILADKAQQWQILEGILRDLRPPYFYPPQPRRDLRPLHDLIGRAKQENVGPEALIDWATARVTGSGDLADQVAQVLLQAGEVFQRYQQELESRDSLEFEDMIQGVVRGVKESPAFHDVVRARYRHVMVDEFQDANFIQSLLIEALVAPPFNIVAVADDDQSIYRFRGASLSNIRRFRRTYPNSGTAALERNYRSTLEIVGVTSNLIELYEHREPKDLSGERGSGAPVRVVGAPDVLSEAEWVASECKRLIDDGASPSSIAILARTNLQLAPFAQALASVPLVVDQSGGGSLFARPEIKDVLALLRAAADPSDDQALLRLLRLPRYGVGAGARLAIASWIRASGRALLQAAPTDLAQLEAGDLAGLRRLKSDVTHLAERAQLSDGRTTVFEILERTEYVGVPDAEDSSERNRAAANLRRLVDIVTNLSLDNPGIDAHGLLEYLRIAAQADTEEGESPRDLGLSAVRLSTAHSAKGLEFDHVFVVNVSQGMFPIRVSERHFELPADLVEDADIAGGEHLDEERRLFYVAMTRAKESLTLCYADRYSDWEKNERPPSQFLTELRERVPSLLSESRAPQASLPPVRGITRAARTPDLTLAYSVSELLSFSDCPLRYAYQSEYQLPQRPSRELVLGSLLHSTLEQAARRRIGGQQVDEPTVLNYLNRAWNNTAFDKVAWKDLKVEATAALHQYISQPQWTAAEIVEAERTFEVDVDGVRFRGRIDRIDRVGTGYKVVDYKSGRAKAEVEARTDQHLRRQFGLYGAAAAQILGTDEIDLEAHFISAGAVTPISQLQDLKWAWAVSREIDTARVAGHFPPKPSDFTCPGCPFRLICDEGKEYLRRRKGERDETAT